MAIQWISLLAACAASAASPSGLPKDLQTFLGSTPPGYEKNYGKPAKQLRNAIELRTKQKLAPAIAALLPLAEHSEYAEHATFELALAYREKKEFAKSTTQASRLWLEFPGSVYQDRGPDIIRDNDCDLALEDGKKVSGTKLRANSLSLLQRCLNKTPWKEWAKRSVQAEKLYENLTTSKDPLLGSFIAEVIQAMPANSSLRRRIANEIPDSKLAEYASLARFRAKSSNPAGVKAVFPDFDLFDSGMQAVLKEKWSDANGIFKKVVADYPQSERIDSANYWIALTEEKMGNAEAAKVGFEQIITDSPLSYYGLQSALHLKKDLHSLLSAAKEEEEKSPRLSGSLLTRQALSLWKLRGLLEAGLIDQAREEAKFLFAYRPAGSTLGQEDGLATLMIAKLYTEAGYPLAAFAHAYNAISFNKDLLEPNTLAFIFPRNYESEFTAAANVSGVDPFLLYSVAKQESAFIPNALSKADALGLLQLIPGTGQEMKPGLKREELFDPGVNTMLGGRYLRKLLDRFQGNIALALAGYNAGPNRAQQWQKLMLEAPAMKSNFDVDIFIDTIPFAETRKYVGSILRNFAWYKLLANDATITSVQELAFQWQKPVKKQDSPSPKASTPKSSDTSAPTDE
jgi:soluble lytic murein transglycosylase-like protein